MKTNIIYNSISEKSSENALLCRQSFNNFKGWDVEIFDGCNPLNLHKYHNKYIQKNVVFIPIMSYGIDVLNLEKIWL